MPDSRQITHLLNDIREGTEEAYEKLFPLVYQELKQLAYSNLQDERDDITYTKTALVHEVYLKLVQQGRLEVANKNHFLAIAARCMRQILVDHARKKQAEKRGNNIRDITFIDELLKVQQESDHIVELDKKLKELEKIDERMARVVTLRFFGQMTVYSTAKALEVSERTVKRDWAKARGWLYKELKSE
ncbi:ECF-type sigma factor [Fodinibius halophilus]|uniref:Sigma-70 family RNA polymerase sigma factor n=1 Tax=Fodinibius halophilus TaxID=1736908 RepID=A0A6M1T1B3_9BACT|nr:ECF-type sigma factor [Fodinibius halophilus]NGP87759.1 sigma-70 family RNA polymerase sigma factor [Fodinibius halophilus]